MPNKGSEGLTLVEEEMNRQAPIPGALPETAAGWVMRVATAAMDYVRGGETAAGWEQLQVVIGQAKTFLARIETANFCRKETLFQEHSNYDSCGFPNQHTCNTCLEAMDWNLEAYGRYIMPCLVAADCLQDVADRLERRC